MPTYTVSASRLIPAPSAKVYAILADYHVGHVRILPPAFHSLVVEQGGTGAGTVVSFKATVMGSTLLNRVRITEPDPGRVLQEAEVDGKYVTTFTLDAAPGGTLVTIRTEAQSRGGLAGVIERALSKRFLRSTFDQELALLAQVASE